MEMIYIALPTVKQIMSKWNICKISIKRGFDSVFIIYHSVRRRDCQVLRGIYLRRGGWQSLIKSRMENLLDFLELSEFYNLTTLKLYSENAAIMSEKMVDMSRSNSNQILIKQLFAQFLQLEATLYSNLFICLHFYITQGNEYRVYQSDSWYNE